MEETQAPAVRGLAVADRGLRLELARTTAPRGRRVELAFRITDRRGAAVRAFDVEHTRRMHLIVVRRDFTGFQHLHPRMGADGTWTVPLTLRDAGAYRVFADFAGGAGGPHAGDRPVRRRRATLAGPARAGRGRRGRRPPGPPGRRRRPAPARSPTLSFTVTRDGKPVAIASYLGAKGHLVALREGDLAFLHVHPDAKRLRFMATFPAAGAHRLFLQFKTADGRRTPPPSRAR